MKRLGIIGGMGPAATARLFTRIIDYTDASRDQDHLDVRIISNPTVPDRTAFLLNAPGADDFVPILQREALELEAAGCEVLAIPCNTSHARYADIAKDLTTAKLMHMPDEAARAAQTLNSSTVGILATDGTVACNVYQHSLEACGLKAATPEQQTQRDIMSVIYDYVKADVPVPDGMMERIFDSLIQQGCDALLLGCTELSAPHGIKAYRDLPIIDALDVLASRSVQECGAPVRLPLV